MFEKKSETKSKQDKVSKVLIITSIFLLSFGTFNLTTSTFAQENNEITVSCVDSKGNTVPCAKPFDMFIQEILEQFLSTVAPLVGGAVTIGINFARKQGLKISAEAEEYFVNSAKSFVDNQSRFIFKQFRDNEEYRKELAQGRMPEKLGKEVFTNVKSQLLTELKSDEFTSKTRDMLTKNLESLIERTLSENKTEIAKRTKNLLMETVPLAVDAALLYYQKGEITSKKDEIVNSALKAVAKNFDSEYIIMSADNAKMYVEAELKRRLDSISN